ncbi:UNVERIFIED_CONTAM: hypothetical protein GTU68_043650 [Idotea baltica]|nr:hypothetical protein [Idotea baltica]
MSVDSKTSFPEGLPSPRQEFIINDSTSTGDRLDRVLVEFCGLRNLDFSRSKIQDFIKSGCVEVNGRTATKAKFSVSPGDKVVLTPPDETPDELIAQDIPIAILFEDEHLLVINKPIGLVIHPAAGNPDGTLVNALLHHVGESLRTVGEVDRPGIVHRLDKDTSGCLVAAKTEIARADLVSQFAGRETSKTYLAVVEGCPPSESGRIENRIGRHPVHRQRMAVVEPPVGKEAITEFTVANADSSHKWALIECQIFTGRTHQIRVHMKENLHCPIVGDPIYANPKRQQTKTGRLMLHAWKLGFRHPVSGETMTFEAPVPDPFEPFMGD